MKRNYGNLAVPQLLASEVPSTGQGATSVLNVTSTATFPDPPFILSIDRGTPSAEVVLCTDKDGTSFTVTRGFDGTQSVAHEVGAIIEHIGAAIDFREAGIVRVTNTERDAFASGDLWVGRTIWVTYNEGQSNEYGQLEVREGSIWVPLHPAGTVMAHAGWNSGGSSDIPPGYLVCNGQSVNRNTYARLFAAIGTTYGAGNGSTTFNVPNVNRRAIMGRQWLQNDVMPFEPVPGEGLNVTGGSEVHTHTYSGGANTGQHNGHQHDPGTLRHNYFDPTGPNRVAWVGQAPTGGGPFVSVQSLQSGGGTLVVREHVHELGPMRGQSATGGVHTHTLPALNDGSSLPPFIRMNILIRV